jgi:hypothetical protein
LEPRQLESCCERGIKAKTKGDKMKHTVTAVLLVMIALSSACGIHATETRINRAIYGLLGPVHEERPEHFWLQGERMRVIMRRGGYYGDSLISVVEKSLRGRGAIVVVPTGRSYNDREKIGAVYEAQMEVIQDGNQYATVLIDVVEIATNELKAQGYGLSHLWPNDRFGSFAAASRAAVWDLE